MGADHHTYFVGCDEWGFSVWAHNAACTPEQADIRIKLLQSILSDDKMLLSASHRAKIHTEIKQLEAIVVANATVIRMEYTQAVQGKPSRTRTVFKNTTDFDGGIPAVVDREPGHVTVQALAMLDKGASNKDLMLAGYHPIGRDGKQINLHHIFKKEPGPMIEMLASVHQLHDTFLHGQKETGKGVQNGASKSAYRLWAKNYWKNRAKDF